MLSAQTVQSARTSLGITPVANSGNAPIDRVAQFQQSMQGGSSDNGSTGNDPFNTDQFKGQGAAVASQYGDIGKNMESSMENTGQDVIQNTSRALGSAPADQNDEGSFGANFAGDLTARLASLGHIAGDALVSAFTPLTTTLSALIPPKIKNDYQSSVNYVADKITNNPKALAMLQTANHFADSNPDMAIAITKDLPGVLGAMGGSEASGGNPDVSIGGAKGAASTAVSDVSDIANTAKENLKNAPPVTGTTKTQVNDLQNSAIKDTTPSYDKSLVGESAIRNPDGSLTPRINEAQGLNKRTVNSTQSEVSAGNELAKIKGYDPTDTSLEKAQLTESEIATKGKALDTSLENEHILRPPQELNKIIKTAVNDAADKSVLISKADPAVKNYLRASERVVSQTDGTLAGERQVILKLDQAYEDAGGKYSNNKPLDQIHRAARTSLIDDMEAKAQNTEVKALLKSMQNLYNADDVLWDKARAEGGSKFEQLVKKHPVISKIIKKGANMVGLGETVNLIDH